MNYIVGALNTLFSALKPFLAGFLIAYILALPCDNIEKLFIKKCKVKQKTADILAVILTEILTLTVMTIFCMAILPQCYESIVKIIANIPDYLNSLNNLINSFIENNNILRAFGVKSLESDTGLQDYIVNSLNSDVSELSTELYNEATRLIDLITDSIVAYVSSIFILFNRHRAVEAFKVFIFTVFHKSGSKFIDILGESNQIFRRFVFGKFIDSLLIGILTFIFLSVFNLPYKVFNATFIGITNMIPIFGPIIGAIPGFLIILVESPADALKFAALILVIQQFDGHILGPRLIGGQIGISTYWVLFSVVVFGKLFGIVGMFFGVPIFATVYMTIKREIREKRVAQLKEEEKDNITDNSKG